MRMKTRWSGMLNAIDCQTRTTGSATACASATQCGVGSDDPRATVSLRAAQSPSDARWDRCSSSGGDVMSVPDCTAYLDAFVARCCASDDAAIAIRLIHKLCIVRIH